MRLPAKLHQPMDMDIIATTKRLYRSKLLAIRVSTMHDVRQLSEQAATRRWWRARRAVRRHKPHVLDDIEILVEAYPGTQTFSGLPFYFCEVAYGSVLHWHWFGRCVRCH